MILLRSEADCPELSGHLQLKLPDGRVTHDFYYDVVRLWQIPVEALLQGGLATLPLAPLAKMTLEQLPEVLRRIEKESGSRSGIGRSNRLSCRNSDFDGVEIPQNPDCEIDERISQNERVCDL